MFKPPLRRSCTGQGAKRRESRRARSAKTDCGTTKVSGSARRRPGEGRRTEAEDETVGEDDVEAGLVEGDANAETDLAQVTKGIAAARRRAGRSKEDLEWGFEVDGEIGSKERVLRRSRQTVSADSVFEMALLLLTWPQGCTHGHLRFVLALSSHSCTLKVSSACRRRRGCSRVSKVGWRKSLGGETGRCNIERRTSEAVEDGKTTREARSNGGDSFRTVCEG